MFSINPNEIKRTADELYSHAETLKNLKWGTEEVKDELAKIEGVESICPALNSICECIQSEISQLNEYTSALERIIWEYGSSENSVIDEAQGIAFVVNKDNMVFWNNNTNIDSSTNEWLETMLN